MYSSAVGPIKHVVLMFQGIVGDSGEACERPGRSEGEVSGAAAGWLL